jgi:uncharacterized protein DUF3303
MERRYRSLPLQTEASIKPEILEESTMKHICYFSWEPNTQQQNEALRRFKASGGQTPKGVKLLGRWIRADFMGGVVVLESDDAKALTEFALTWSDVMTLQVIPVIEDQDLVEVLERTGK